MVKFLFEIIPTLIFFIIFKFSDIFVATYYLLVSSLICLAIIYYIHKKISGILVISTIILICTSTITLLSGDPSFIKMKPTILNLVFAIILFSGLIKKKGFIKYMLGQSIKMSDEYWQILSFRFALFFIFLAVLNEIIWRNFSENFWVNFKLFGLIPVVFLFILTQMPFILKHQNDEKNAQ